MKKVRTLPVSMPIELELKLERLWKKLKFKNRSQYIVHLIKKGLEENE